MLDDVLQQGTWNHIADRIITTVSPSVPATMMAETLLYARALGALAADLRDSGRLLLSPRALVGIGSLKRMVSLFRGEGFEVEEQSPGFTLHQTIPPAALGDEARRHLINHFRCLPDLSILDVSIGGPIPSKANTTNATVHQALRNAIDAAGF